MRDADSTVRTLSLSDTEDKLAFGTSDENVYVYSFVDTEFTSKTVTLTDESGGPETFEETDTWDNEFPASLFDSTNVDPDTFTIESGGDETTSVETWFEVHGLDGDVDDVEFVSSRDTVDVTLEEYGVDGDGDVDGTGD